MQGLYNKLRLIYKPFVIIAIGFILTYTFFHWALFIEAEIPLKEEVIKFWLPFGLPWIPILIWLRPRIKLLSLKNDNASFGYQFIASLAIAMPTIIAQEYLVTATGKLTEIDNISQIVKSEKTKYYSIRNYFIDKQHIAVQSTATVTGKNSENFNMLIYVAMPILENNADTLKPEQKYWLGKEYMERISNGLSDKEKEDKYKVFAEKCQKEFEATDFNKFTYLEVIGNTDDHDEYNNALKKINQKSLADNIVFEAKADPFEARNGKKLAWIFGSLAIGALVFFIFLLFSKFQQAELEKFKSGEIKKDTDFKEMLGIFIQRKVFLLRQLSLI